jgi:hypothetical protein
MKLELAVLADFASLTQDGKLNILGIFHEVNPPMLPFPLPQLYLVTSFEAESEDYGKQRLIRVVLREENDVGAEMLAIEGLAQVPQPTRSGEIVLVNHVLGLSGVTFERAGAYEFSISVDGEGKAAVSLRVTDVADDPRGDPNV